MGIVYLCYDHEERQAVALKTFLGHLLNNETANLAVIKQAASSQFSLRKDSMSNLTKWSSIAESAPEIPAKDLATR